MKIQHFVNKKSNVVLENGTPKLPSVDTIEWGEIAVNYAKEHETISIKNDENEIVTFSSDALVRTLSGQVIDDELAIAKAMDRFNDSCGFDEHGIFNPTSQSLSACSNVTEALDTLEGLGVKDIDLSLYMTDGSSELTSLVIPYSIAELSRARLHYGREDVSLYRQTRLWFLVFNELPETLPESDSRFVEEKTFYEITPDIDDENKTVFTGEFRRLRIGVSDFEMSTLESDIEDCKTIDVTILTQDEGKLPYTVDYLMSHHCIVSGATAEVLKTSRYAWVMIETPDNYEMLPSEVSSGTIKRTYYQITPYVDEFNNEGVEFTGIIREQTIGLTPLEKQEMEDAINEIGNISQLLSEILGEPTDTLDGKVTRILGE